MHSLLKIKVSATFYELTMIKRSDVSSRFSIVASRLIPSVNPAVNLKTVSEYPHGSSIVARISLSGFSTLIDRIAQFSRRPEIR